VFTAILAVERAATKNLLKTELSFEPVVAAAGTGRRRAIYAGEKA
jgi:hypothetical protein